MRITFDRSDWLRALSAMADVAPGKNASPTLRCVTLCAYPALGTVRLAAEDGGEMRAVADCPATIDPEGADALRWVFAVRADLLHGFIRSAMDMPITLQMDARDGDLHVSWGAHWRFTLNTYGPNPALLDVPAVTDPLHVTWPIPPPALFTALARTHQFCAPWDGVTPHILSGVHLAAEVSEGGHWVLASRATDAFTLAVQRVELQHLDSLQPVTTDGVVVPGRAAQRMANALAYDSSAHVAFHCSRAGEPQWLWVTSGGVRMGARLLSGRYPELGEVEATAAVPSAGRVSVRAGDLLPCLARVRLLGEQVDASLQVTGDVLRVQSAAEPGLTGAGNSLRDAVPVLGSRGALSVVVPAEPLMDLLFPADEDDTVLLSVPPGGPLMVEPGTSGFRAFLMPRVG